MVPKWAFQQLTKSATGQTLPFSRTSLIAQGPQRLKADNAPRFSFLATPYAPPKKKTAGRPRYPPDLAGRYNRTVADAVQGFLAEVSVVEPRSAAKITAIMQQDDLEELRTAVAALEHPGLAARLAEIAG
jgi:hypothetical protein